MSNITERFIKSRQQVVRAQHFTQQIIEDQETVHRTMDVVIKLGHKPALLNKKLTGDNLGEISAHLVLLDRTVIAMKGRLASMEFLSCEQGDLAIEHGVLERAGASNPTNAAGTSLTDLFTSKEGEILAYGFDVESLYNDSIDRLGDISRLSNP